MPEIYQPGSARRLASRAAAAVGLRYYDVLFCERDLTQPLPEIQPRRLIDVRVADGEDIEAMLAMRQGDERRVIERIARIGVGYVAEAESGLVGYAWARAGAMHIFCRRPLEYHELAELPAGAFYTNNSYVLPAARGAGIFQALLACQYRDRAANGFRTATNLIETVNLDSLAAHRRLGHRMQPARIVKLPAAGPRLSYRGAGPSWSRAA